MKVRTVMNARPRTVREHDTLNQAARIMWDRDCGWVPVVDDGGRVVGVITDRDICMAAYTRGSALEMLAVAGAMCTDVHSVRADDPLEQAMTKMRTHRVRRLPVTDEDQVLVGLVSMSDLARRSMSNGKLREEDVTRTLAAICEPRSATEAA